MMNVKIGENIKLKIVDYSFEIPINEDGVEIDAIVEDDGNNIENIDISIIPYNYKDGILTIEGLITNTHRYIITFKRIQNKINIKNKTFKLIVQGVM